MATASAIQTSIVHVALGIVSGSMVEYLLPPASASASAATLAFEAFVQVGLNGVLLASMGATLSADDTTYGIPFSMALFEAQPELGKRIKLLSDVVKRQAAQASQKMAPRAVTADTAIQ